MKKLFAVACLAMGLTACGTDVTETVETLESVEQAAWYIPCPEGTTFSHYAWICGAPTSTCSQGRKEEHKFCYDASQGNIVDAGWNGRTQGCCLIVD
ncbi:MAG: hypothetical protein JXB05_34755 [Myxococcaceae bacterium]|nr:hypothetical protein [Myxococcaceae bacterium]